MTRFEKFKLCIRFEAAHITRWYIGRTIDFLGALATMILVLVLVLLKPIIVIYNVATLPFTADDQSFERLVLLRSKQSVPNRNR